MAEADRVGSVVIQVGHGFARATVVRFDGTDWVRGLAGEAGLRLVGSIIDQDSFQAVQLGELDGLADLDLTPGTQYYAHPTIAGAWTSVANSSPIFRAYTTSIIHVEPSTTSPATAAAAGFVTSHDLATAIAIEVARANSADAAILANANAHSDTQDIVTLADAEAYADAQLAVAEAYTDAQIAALDEKYAAENKEGATIAQGFAVATDVSGTGVVLACAVDGTLPCVGLMVADTLDTVAGDVQTDGIFTLADWTAVTGTATLTRGPYFLDPTTPGMLTATAPTTDGQVVQVIGYAVSSVDLDISIDPPILL